MKRLLLAVVLAAAMGVGTALVDLVRDPVREWLGRTASAASLLSPA